MASSLQSATKTGVPVILTGEDYCGSATVRVEFVHPKLGKVLFRSSEFGSAQGNDGIIGWIGSQRCCITVPRIDFDTAILEAKAIAERELIELRVGDRKIKLTYVDGEYLSGHAVHGRAAGLLLSLGIAEEVNGWGTHVGHEAVEALGEEFTYEQAAAFARPALEQKQAAKDARDQERWDKFSQARTTGKPVELRRWSEDCCERDCDCSCDIVYEMAMPDGSTKCDRVHTH